MKLLTLAWHTLSLYATSLTQRAETSAWYTKLASVLGAVFTAVVTDLLFGAILLAGGASLVDWYWGRARARKEGHYQTELAHIGWQIKAGTLCVVLLVRGAEAWLSAAPEPLRVQTMGALSAALAVGVFVDELDSIDENMIALGGRGIPGLSRVLAWLRAVQGRWTLAAKGKE